MSIYTVEYGVSGIPTTTAGVALDNGDELRVDSGGTASQTTVNSGGIASVYDIGTISGSTINNGGYQYLQGGVTDQVW